MGSRLFGLALWHEFVVLFRYNAVLFDTRSASLNPVPFGTPPQMGSIQIERPKDKLGVESVYIAFSARPAETPFYQE